MSDWRELLEKIVRHGQGTWGICERDVKAIGAALAEIERLTAELAEAKVRAQPPRPEAGTCRYCGGDDIDVETSSGSVDEPGHRTLYVATCLACNAVGPLCASQDLALANFLAAGAPRPEAIVEVWGRDGESWHIFEQAQDGEAFRDRERKRIDPFTGGVKFRWIKGPWHWHPKGGDRG